MGTTMTFVCLHADGATVAHIGDSRIYQLRPAKDGNPAQIVFRTQDHSLVNDLGRVGEITEEEAKHHPQKNVITRAMQPCQERRAKADITHLTDIQPGDYFYMCSDGMLEEATDENILNIITMPDKTDEEKLEMLRKVTEENKDNHTAHLIHINKVEGAVVTPPAVEAEQGPKGILITPDEEPKEAPASKAPVASIKQQPAVAPSQTGFSAASQPKKKRNPLLLIAGAVVIAAIAVAATFFPKTGKGDEAVARQDGAVTESQQEISYSNGVLTAKGETYDMVEVEAGTFTMGATSEMKNPWNDEKPAHQVTLTKNYYIGKTEVTQALWKAVMNSNPSNFKGNNKPVESVSWDDCQEFISKLNAATGKNFRLPTETEWEFAARGGNNSRHYQYSGSNDLFDVAWYTDNSSNTTHDVASKQANKLGLYDMSGNVYEWCSDWHRSYSSNHQYDPAGPTSGSYRVFRGGSWYCSARGCRSSYRGGSSPGSWSDDLGLRLALTE